ncbi:MAG TPA: DUF4416 family protein [Pirellulales bacterium]|nr:DUF4416 family protein [Pirellulales bacterium]
MGLPNSHTPVAAIVAVISRHDAALEWAVERAVQYWGPVARRSPTFAFRETDYYEPTMGAELGKTFLSFERLADPSELAAWKHATNAWEAEYATLGRHLEPRPLNLDPGYITAAKLVLASTKDHAHRIYLGQQMFAEVTLYLKQGGWQHRDWTFPDYRREDYQQFFLAVRHDLRQRTPKPGLP